MTPAEFDARVDELLDERRDPIDDADCAAFLADHPERVAPFVAMRERLAALPSARVHARVPRPRVVAMATTAAAIVIAAAWWTFASGAPAAPRAINRVFAASSSRLPLHPDGDGSARARDVLIARSDARLEAYVRW